MGWAVFHTKATACEESRGKGPQNVGAGREEALFSYLGTYGREDEGVHRGLIETIDKWPLTMRVRQRT